MPNAGSWNIWAVPDPVLSLRELVMTPHQTRFVRDTFACIAPTADEAARIFYGKLFDRDPRLQALFPSGMSRQRMALMRTIGVAVDHLDRLDTLVPMVEDLGRRHVAYGVEPHHYLIVGGALLDTLREGLGAAFTPEVETAWQTAYGLLTAVMLAGAKAAAPAITGASEKPGAPYLVA